jgi:uncharacterized protein (TIGR01777 family)
MHIVIAGGSGFLGRALHTRLLEEGHPVTVLTRQPRVGARGDVAWTPNGSAGEWAQALEGADAIVNLAGEGIADRRWNDARKEALKSSRILATRSLVRAIAQLKRPPSVFASASGVGYYGASGDELLTESSPPGSDFLADLCVEWEREAEQAAAVTRVSLLRNGLVLHPEGGTLGKMLLPFRLGVGGPLGSGSQYMSWIHISDWVNLVLWILHTPDARGAFNVTAPNPVTNAEFSRTLGRVLRRPAFLPVPGFELRILFGELAISMLTGQRVVPARAEGMRFQFMFGELEAALSNLLR